MRWNVGTGAFARPDKRSKSQQPPIPNLRGILQVQDFA
jgi:hypothetical protein